MLQRRLAARADPAALAPTGRTVVASAALQEPPLIELLEERKLGAFFERVADKPVAIIELLQEAGLSGIIAYAICFVCFYSVAGSAAELAYHSASGRWVDPRVLLQDDGAAGKAETLALLGSFYLACKPFAPLRLGGALILTPDVNKFIEARPAVAAAADAIEAGWDGTVGAGFRAASTALAPVATAIKESPLAVPIRREFLKSELLELAEESDGGVTPLAPEAQERLEELVTTVLPRLNPTAEPARSDGFSAEWECRWTSEKEINFAREKGLFGQKWQRTYQLIDIEAGTLTNVLEFEDAELTVGSTIAPDEDSEDGSRFNFAFEKCTLRWRSFEVPLPPVGRGWGELLYLDDEMRIQRDVRGDLLVATKVPSPRELVVEILDT